jgi:hypothetical protein
MTAQPLGHPRISVPLPEEGDAADSADTAGVNGRCHDYTAGVDPHDRHVLTRPLIVPIFWGRAYTADPTIVAAGVQLLSDIATHGYLHGLAQYGVGRAAVLDAAVIDLDPRTAPATLDEHAARDQLVAWLRAGAVAPAPSVNETRRLYFLFPPTSTALTLSDGTTGFCGYHQFARYHDNSDAADLFWGIARTTTAAGLSGTAFMQKISYCVSHEVAEACSDRDDRGWRARNGCEIGDICELQPRFTLTNTWRVEQYWSAWDTGCISGAAPVSLGRFAAAVGVDVQGRGLRALQMPVISIDSIAARVRQTHS